MRAKQISSGVEPRNSNDGFSAFIEEIRNGNVLLMVGHAFEGNPDVFPNGDFYQYLTEELNETAGTSNLDFSDLSYDNRFLLDKENHNRIRDIHEEIRNIIEKNEYSAEEDVSKDLLGLIKTGFFRFIFTTSFDPLVEVAMREQFGEVRVMNIYDKDKRDITSREDFQIPTIYYLFGKAELPKENQSLKTFVATDNDALEVLRKWQLEMSNSLLLQYTSNKYLLTLGCTYDDWLFRFIWYTMKGNSDKLSKGCISGHKQSESLAHYLKMNKILIDNNPKELVSKIIKAVSDDESKWNTPQLNCDIFISYSRADSELAEKLYKSLASKGLRVWYDKKNLAGHHGGFYMEALKQSIDTSTLFIAILSNSISEQSGDPHIYRREWEWAKDLKLGLTADCRCYGVCADNYDIDSMKYKDALGWLAATDNFEFSHADPDFNEMADVLRDKMNQLKK